MAAASGWTVCELAVDVRQSRGGDGRGKRFDRLPTVLQDREKGGED